MTSVFKFSVGDEVWPHNWELDKPATVVERITHTSGFPHYRLKDPRRKQPDWIIPQIHLCSRPLPPPSSTPAGSSKKATRSA